MASAGKGDHKVKDDKSPYAHAAARRTPYDALRLPWSRKTYAVLLAVALCVAGFAFIMMEQVARPAIAGFSGQSGSGRTVSTAVASSEDGKSAVLVDPALPEEAVVIDVLMAGDILMHDLVVSHGQKEDGSYDYGFLFKNVTSLVKEADVRILNQETVMGEPSKGYAMRMIDSVSPAFNTPIELADAEVEAGFNVVIKATNHTYDQGYTGLAHELGYWKTHYPDIPVLGVDNPDSPDGDQDWVDNVYIYEKDGFRVAILNYTFGTNLFVDYSREYRICSYLDDDKIRKDVQQARDLGADMIVACPHWGREYLTTPSDEERHYSQLFCELGVDVVFGTHPHIMQPVQVMENEEGHRTVCFFSNGNLVAAGGFKADSLISGLARVTLVKEPDGSCRVDSASLVATIMAYTDTEDMSVYLVSDYPDKVAASSYRPELTRAYANDFCSGLFGEGYDPQTGIYTVDLG